MNKLITLFFTCLAMLSCRQTNPEYKASDFKAHQSICYSGTPVKVLVEIWDIHASREMVQMEDAALTIGRGGFEHHDTSWKICEIDTIGNRIKLLGQWDGVLHDEYRFWVNCAKMKNAGFAPCEKLPADFQK